MRLLKSVLLRLIRILLATSCICLVLMAATLYLQMAPDDVPFLLILAAVLGAGLAFTSFIIKNLDSELSAEVARILYPSSALLCVVMGWMFSVYLEDMLPDEGMQHWVVALAGASIAVFMLIRCFDIKWLPSEAEIADLERSRH